jgi:hypothetical protein
MELKPGYLAVLKAATTGAQGGGRSPGERTAQHI